MPEAKVLGINTARGTETLSFYAVPYQVIEEPMKEWRTGLVIQPAPTPAPDTRFETIEVGGNSYTINKILDPAPPRWSLHAGKRLVAIDITQVALVNDAYFNPLYFSVQDSDGYVYDRSGSADVEPRFSSGDLNAGQRVRGWVTFEIPSSSTLVSVLVEPNRSSQMVVIADLTQ